MTSTRLAAVTATAVCALAMLPGTAGAATITPNSTGDDFDPIGMPDAECTVREAIESAVTNGAYGGCTAGDSGTDTILLTAPPADSYTTDIGSYNEGDVNGESDFDVRGGGPIVVRGTNKQQLDTSATDRIFDVRAGADLTLENVIVHGGNPRAGGLTQEERRGGNIRANTSTGSLTLNDVIVRFGLAEDGGGIYAADGNQLSIIDSRVENNNASGDGGGVFGVGGPGALNVQITRSLIRDNFASSNVNGSGLVRGGGISFAGQQLTVTDSEITDNQAVHTGNMTGDSATGGGISTGSNTTIRRSLIAGNSATATNGSEEKGGGILAEGGGAADAINVVNSTIYENTAGDAGNTGEGGGVFTKDDADPGSDIDVVLSHVTMSANRATQPLGIPVGDHLQTATPADAGAISLRGSVLTSVFGVIDPCGGDKISSAGFNATVNNDVDCGFGPTDSTGVPTGLASGAPTDNGGFSDTIALQPGGSAVNLIAAAQCGPAEGQDQRGYPRPLPVAGACDAGAYELHSCGGAVLNGPFVGCPVPAANQPTTPTTPAAPKKCKKKKKKGRKGAAAAAKKKGCKKKRKK